ncbi:MAG: glycosyltransferase family 39 protein [Candidatus Moraniibacteriota bacterium]
MRRQDRIDQYLAKNPHVTERQLMRKFGLNWNEAVDIRRAHTSDRTSETAGRQSAIVSWFYRLMASERGTLFTLVVLATAVRVAYAFFLWRDSILTTPLLDAEYYVKWAEEIVRTGWLGDRIFFTEPFYAYFLSVFLKLLGTSGLSVTLFVQFSLGVVLPVILYFIGRRLFDRPTGILAGIIAALYGPFVFYEGLFLKTSLEVFSFSLFLLVALWAFEKKQWKQFLLAGVVLGCAVLIKGNTLVFWPIVIGLFALVRTLERQTKWQLGLVFSFGVMLCILPVTLRNYVVGHDFVPTNYSIGLVMYQGSWWGSDGSTAEVPRFLRPHPKYEEADAVGMAEAYAGTVLKPSEVSRFWMKKSWQEVLAAPGHYIFTLGNKLLLITHPVEFSDNYSYSFYRSAAPILWLLIPYWLLFPIACLGLLFLFRRQWLSIGEEKIIPSLPLLMLAAYVGILLLTTINARYRVPLTPLTILFAAHAIMVLRHFFQSREAARLLWAGSFLSVLFLLMIVGLFSSRYALIEANTYHTIGYAALERGDYPEAKAWFQKTITLDSRYAWAYGNLMLIALFEGNLPEAKENLKTLILLRSDDLSNYDRLKLIRSLEQTTPAVMREQAQTYFTESRAAKYDADFYEGKRLIALGDKPGAEVAFERSLSRDAQSEAALIALAGLKKEKGESSKVIEYLRRAVLVNPYNFIARYNLANAYIETQNFGQVAVLLKDIYEFTPELGDAWYNYAVALAKLGKFDEAVPITQAFVDRYRDDPSKKDKVSVFEKALEASKKSGLEGLLKQNAQ